MCKKRCVQTTPCKTGGSYCFFTLLHFYVLAVNSLNLSVVASQPNKEWKPKASVKPSPKGPGVIGSPAKTVSPPAHNTEVTQKEAAVLQDNMSQLNLSENQNVIIAPHIRVSETDRCRLTFGSLGADFDTSANSVGVSTNGVEELSTDPSGRLLSFTNFVMPNHEIPFLLLWTSLIFL